MLAGHLRVPVGDAGTYWLAEPGGATVAVAVLDADTAYVDLTYMILDDPAAEMAPSHQEDSESATGRIRTANGLEVRDLHGRATPIGDSSMGYSAWVVREPAARGRDERHDVVLRPDRFVELPDIVAMAYAAEWGEDEADDVQYDAVVLQSGDPRSGSSAGDDDASRRLAHAIIRTLESSWPEDSDEIGTKAVLLADELARLGAFEANVSESALGLTAYVDSRPLTRAMLTVLEALLSQPGVDREAALAAAIRAAEEIRPPVHPAAVTVRPGVAGISDRVRNGGTPLVRTDYSDDDAWDGLVRAATAPQDVEGEQYAVEVDIVSDPELAGLSVDVLASGWPDDVFGYVLVADGQSMKPGDPTVLYIDLRDERGRSFRCAASEVAAIMDNLAIDNMDFEEFADAVGPDGVYRGS